MRTDFGMRTDLGMRTDFHDANALAVAKADANMNKTVAVLLKMNLSPAKLSEGIRLAVQEADKYRLLVVSFIYPLIGFNEVGQQDEL